ncbi:MAG: ABC transporter permease [Acidobacteriota bacterium]
MSPSDAQETAMTAPAAPPASPQQSRLRQALAVFRFELGRILWGPGVLALLLLAALPAFPFAIVYLVHLAVEQPPGLSEATTSYAWAFQVFILPMVTFFGCVLIFTGLVRREVRERTLHHLFLCPVPRRVVMAGKFGAGVLSASLIFGFSALVTFVLAYLPQFHRHGHAAREFFLAGPGFSHLFQYLLVVVLAAIGYGAVFLCFALFVRNPIIPVFLVLGWESINAFLPPLLKKLSVFHYLHALCPVPLVNLPFALLAEAPSAWVAIPGLLLLAFGLLMLSGWRFQHLEIDYGGE